MDKKTQALVEQYAKSLVEVAVEHNCVSELKSEVTELISVFETTELDQQLSSLAISHDNKEKLVRLLQESCSRFMNNFLEVILQNEREAYLYQILKLSLTLFAEVTKSFDVKVTTAVPLNEDQKSRLLKVVAQKFNFKSNYLIEEIDPSIIGGFVLSANNQIIDTSIRTQLQQLKTNLK
ncbi:ATP synthase F1, delta subunit [Streptococcus urinalis FB127-CNA-2]|uniref:ATP synthase subunit delta n=1 Tax=Streptococcus urinalis 2285-97 TaxID=764291 RepID=G5KF09_9STRE|nr:F0F1 ATP synthase subunit delta [Streptococcus urinalis]EHJ57079.1 ATP synthase F1, delta subunit [Streptococcus urinalis 2285-97]EKS21976.1 ATP synthase F1, delta subunit [Streptococcus urinalis FB127-CNA-2]VEF31788.1 ATP synthase delta chain [Streptococcus urinalis]